MTTIKLNKKPKRAPKPLPVDIEVHDARKAHFYVEMHYITAAGRHGTTTGLYMGRCLSEVIAEAERSCLRSEMSPENKAIMRDVSHLEIRISEVDGQLRPLPPPKSRTFKNLKEAQAEAWAAFRRLRTVEIEPVKPRRGTLRASRSKGSESPSRSRSRTGRR